jgi:hypothetical protein
MANINNERIKYGGVNSDSLNSTKANKEKMIVSGSRNASTRFNSPDRSIVREVERRNELGVLN